MNNQWQSTLIAVCRERRQEAGALVLTREEERPNNRSHPLIEQGAPQVIPDVISSVLDRLFDTLTLIAPATVMVLVLRLHHHGRLVCMFLHETSHAEVLTFGEGLDRRLG